MVKWGFHDSDKCPRCGRAGETAEHVLRCPNVEVRKLWKAGAVKLHRALKKLRTKPSLRTTLVSGLLTWSRGYVPRILGSNDVSSAQFDLGWHALVGGFFHSQWAEEQQAYYLSRGTRQSGYVWLAHTIREIWHIAWSIWQSRNTVLHKPDVHRMYEDMKDVDREIRQEFRRRPPSSCPPLYRHFFYHRDLKEILARSNYHRRKWLLDVQNARAACIRLMDTSTYQQQQTMRRWLGRN